MMKKTFFIVVLFTFFSCLVKSQNIQFHYDLGHTMYGELSGRPNVTTTVEMFKPDRFGSTFLFTDIDYYGDGAAGAYWEVARELNLRKEDSRWAAHGGRHGYSHSLPACRSRWSGMELAQWRFSAYFFASGYV